RSRLKYPSSISSSFGSATAASVDTNGRYAQADAGMSNTAISAATHLIGHSLEHEHLRRGAPFLLLRGRIYSMRFRIDSKAVDLRLDRNILELPEVRWIVHLERRDGAARARDIDPAKSGIEHHDVGAFGHRQVRDRLVRLEIEHGQGVVAFA